jgi:hypothetical protein
VGYSALSKLTILVLSYDESDYIHCLPLSTVAEAKVKREKQTTEAKQPEQAAAEEAQLLCEIEKEEPPTSNGKLLKEQNETQQATLAALQSANKQRLLP